MKTLRTVLALAAACLMLAAFSGQAAAQVMSMDPKIASDKLAKKAFFACAKCEMASMKAGKCPGCLMKMVSINADPTYACAKCHTSSKMGGKCPKCNQLMKVMAHTYACEACKVTARKAGKCTKCGKALKEHFLKIGVAK